MTQIDNPLYDYPDPVAVIPRDGVTVSKSLDEMMTVLEVAVGSAMWAQGKVKIPRDALTRMCLDLKSMFGDERCNLLSSTTYGQFYSGQVGVPTVHMPAATEIPKAVRQAVNRIYPGPEEYRDGSCV